jgi:hypothetical protein
VFKLKIINLDALKKEIETESSHMCSGCESNCTRCDDLDQYIQLKDLYAILEKYRSENKNFQFR